MKIQGDSIKIQPGSIDFDFEINVSKDWALYSHDNSGEIGKPFDIKFFVISGGEKKQINSNDVFKNFKSDSMIVMKELETLDSKRKIETRVFGNKTEIEIKIKDERILKDSKIIGEISGSICQKESGEREGEICIPVFEKIELN